MVALGQSEPEIAEVLAEIGAKEEEDAEDYLDRFFNPTTYPRDATRFSTGFWPAYYAALDWETVHEEVWHHHKTDVGRISFARIECTMQTSRCYDLRPLTARFPYLIEVENSAYPSCQALAAEAIARGAEAFLTVSARRQAGVNSPTFVRSALFSPAITGRVALRSEGERFVVEEVD